MKKKDLTGQKFGKLTAIQRYRNIENIPKLQSSWECKCECGGNKIARTSDLLKGRYKSCGCDLLCNKYNIGFKINRLTILNYINNTDIICKCDCGNITKLKINSLINSYIKSCGCLKVESSKSKEKIEKLQAGRRKYTPEMSSAHRIFQAYSFKDKQMMSFEDFYKLSQMNCFYCGIEPSNKYNTFTAKGSEKSKNDGYYIYNGLDRIDSSKYHTLDNCVPCCYICNISKNNRNIDNFLNWVNKLQINIFTPFNLELINLPTKYLLASVKRTYYSYIKNDNKMIDLQTFYTLSQLPCFYCGAEKSNCYNPYISNKTSNKKMTQFAKDSAYFYYNGIDRVNSNLNHTIDNIVPCCFNCNWSKNNLSLKEFNEWIERIKNYQKNKKDDIIISSL